MLPDLNEFFRSPEPERVTTDWSEDLIIVRVGKYSLGIEARLEIINVVVETMEFLQNIGEIEKDQMSDDLARIALSMEGR